VGNGLEGKVTGMTTAKIQWTKPEINGIRTCKQYPQFTIEKVEGFGSGLKPGAGQTVYDVVVEGVNGNYVCLTAFSLSQARSFVANAIQVIENKCITQRELDPWSGDILPGDLMNTPDGEAYVLSIGINGTRLPGTAVKCWQ
jgi:hypothetical protein